MCLHKRQPNTFLFVCMILFASIGCLSGSTIPLTPTNEPSTIGVLLTGDPNSLAVSATKDEMFFGENNESELSIDENGMELLRTELEVEFSEGATVQQINDLLQSMNGRIVASIQGVPYITVQIPDPGSLDDLERIINQVESNSMVVNVIKGYTTGKADLPERFQGDLSSNSDLSKLDYILSTRAYAAWNAKEAIPTDQANAPTIIILDDFGNGAPDNAFDVNVIYREDFQRRNNYDGHGYIVLSMLGASFKTDSTLDSERDIPTGMYPGKTRLRVIDLSRSDTHGKSNKALIQLIKATTSSTNGNVIVNTSLQFGCEDAEWACNNPSLAAELGKMWAVMVRGGLFGVNLEDKFIHTTAAGNVDLIPADESEYISATASEFTGAALLPEGELGVAPLKNILVVESLTNSFMQPYTPGCRSVNSDFGGHISAVGDDVFGLSDSRGYGKAGYEVGTSFAAPQVAGLAEYIWRLRPELTVQEVVTILKSTAREADPTNQCSPSASPVAPVIDAYDAILATDLPGTLNVRKAILDVADNNGVDRFDIQIFLTELNRSPGAINYSRYDLNGDGRTGGETETQFHLIPGSGYETRSINIPEVGEVTFDEHTLSDLDILCFYAYERDIFNGTNEELEALTMDQFCGDQEEESSPIPDPAPTLPPTDPEPSQPSGSGEGIYRSVAQVWPVDANVAALITITFTSDSGIQSSHAASFPVPETDPFYPSYHTQELTLTKDSSYQVTINYNIQREGYDMSWTISSIPDLFTCAIGAPSSLASLERDVIYWSPTENGAVPLAGAFNFVLNCSR